MSLRDRFRLKKAKRKISNISSISRNLLKISNDFYDNIDKSGVSPEIVSPIVSKYLEETDKKTEEISAQAKYLMSFFKEYHKKFGNLLDKIEKQGDSSRIAMLKTIISSVENAIRMVNEVKRLEKEISKKAIKTDMKEINKKDAEKHKNEIAERLSKIEEYSNNLSKMSIQIRKVYINFSEGRI